MRLLVVTPYYPPDGGPSAPLFGMLCEELARRGMDVTVIAAAPHYPSGRVLKEFRGRWVRRTVENGVRVVRVGVPSVDRMRLALRALQFLCFQVGATASGLSRRYDVALFSNPGLDVWLPFAVHVVLRRTPAVFAVYDVYPDVGISLGVFRSRAVIAAVASLERFCLRHSASVRIISESFTPALHRLGVADSKLALIDDYVDTDLIRPLSRTNAFSAENGLVDRFVVLYAGNIGLSQGLEDVLLAAERLRAYPDVLFVFVGDGTGRAALVAEAEKRTLDNVRFLPFQPRSRVPEMLASADVSLVMLKNGIGVQSLPNKILSILASGRPLLASVDEDSAAANLLRSSEAGLRVPPGDPPRLAEAVLALRDAPKLRDEMGQNGRRHAVRHHSVGLAAERFEALFRSAVEPACPGEIEGISG
jgi:colanic acid biosynthesis glycosyl transferase WcaI